MKKQAYTHLLIDLSGCDEKAIDSENLLMEMLISFAQMNQLNILKRISYKFTPQGVSCLLLLSESHISMHTWPESGRAAIDCFSCTVLQDIEGGINLLQERLRSKECKVSHIARLT